MNQGFAQRRGGGQQLGQAALFGEPGLGLLAVGKVVVDGVKAHQLPLLIAHRAKLALAGYGGFIGPQPGDGFGPAALFFERLLKTRLKLVALGGRNQR